MSPSEVCPRRWLQFSLRTLFILMLVVAAFFGGRESMRPAIEIERETSRRANRNTMEAEEESQEWKLKATVSDAMIREFVRRELISDRKAREMKRAAEMVQVHP